jgi:hypothetical protein
MIIRIWFYSELMKPRDPMGRPVRQTAQPKRRPLYKAIFSFVFGDGDPNASWESRENQALAAYIQANRGVITLPELMAMTGLKPAEADERITALCAEFGGSPEATEEGTVVYRFDELLRRADTGNRSFPGFSAPIKRLRAFSTNEKGMNTIFGLVNGANIIFGGYYLFNALGTGFIATQAQFDAASYLYKMTFYLLGPMLRIGNPVPLMSVGLGIVPLVFSVFFWLIPALRYFWTRKENNTIKLENFRKAGYSRIWDSPAGLRPQEITATAAECKPANLEAAQDRVLREMGGYAPPELELDAEGKPVYRFPDLEREKAALDKYRGTIREGDYRLGDTVFDSDK